MSITGMPFLTGNTSPQLLLVQTMVSSTWLTSFLHFGQARISRSSVFICCIGIPSLSSGDIELL